MKIEGRLLEKILSDLGANIRYSKGNSVPVKNCWHFCTDGNCIDMMFYDEDDFRQAINRIYILAVKYKIIILAFCLMDNHIHFLFWGDFDECNRFVHDFIRRTSISISVRHGDRNKLSGTKITHQSVADDTYLKTVLCYIIKNPPVAGIPYSYYDYPWSSGALYFRAKGLWTRQDWESVCNMTELRDLSYRTKIAAFGTASLSRPGDRFILKEGIVFPGDFVAYEIVENLYKTVRSFNYFMCKSKDSEVESVGSFLSSLSIPDQEMRQNRDAMCNEMFGIRSVRKLSLSQRLALARALKSRYNSSVKQIARVSGLKYDEVSQLL